MRTDDGAKYSSPHGRGQKRACAASTHASERGARATLFSTTPGGLRQARSCRRLTEWWSEKGTTRLSPVQGLSEQQAWEKRQQEAKEAGTAAATGSWQWTLNWDAIDDMILVGSCPRSASDVDRLVNEAGVEAILCLQSDDCLDALGIPMQEIRDQSIARGVIHSRCAVRDFNHADQAGQLPQAVAVLHTLLLSGKKTYVHCTAGINRATLTVVGYLTFVRSWRLEDALGHVKAKRPCAHPYVDCWTTARRRLLEGRGDELTGISRHMYESRKSRGDNGNSGDDWYCAELQLIREVFDRHAESDLTIIRSMMEISERQRMQQLTEQAQQAEEFADQQQQLHAEEREPDAATLSAVEASAAAAAEAAEASAAAAAEAAEASAAASAEALGNAISALEHTPVVPEPVAKAAEEPAAEEPAAEESADEEPAEEPVAAELAAAPEAEPEAEPKPEPVESAEDVALRDELDTLRAALKEAETRETALKLTITGMKAAVQPRAPVPGTAVEINPALLRENLRIREEAEHWRRECERTRKAMEAMRLASDIAARGGSTANGEDAAVDAAADSVSVPTGR